MYLGYALSFRKWWGFDIQTTGNSPTPNTIPAQRKTELQIKIGAGPYSVTDTKNYLSSRAGKELIPKCFISLFPHWVSSYGISSLETQT